MKRMLIVALCALGVLSGCAVPGGGSPAVRDPVLSGAREALEGTWSLQLDSTYMDLGFSSLEQTVICRRGLDESMCLSTRVSRWRRLSELDETLSTDSYYRREGKELVCYSREGDGAVERQSLSATEERSLRKNWDAYLGVDALLPPWLEELSFPQSGEEGYECLSFRLPLAKLMEAESFLGNFIRSAFLLYGGEPDPGEPCSVEGVLFYDPDTGLPAYLVYDFTQLKPQLLHASAISSEYALGTDMMTLVLEFDFDLPPAAELPQGFSL